MAGEASGAGPPAPSQDACVRLTTRRVPENASQKERAGLPFAVVVQPFRPLPARRDGSRAEPIANAPLARCGECFGYVNGFCGLERDGWICILCGTFSYWDSGNPRDAAGRHRYRRNPDRHLLPEIAEAEYEVEVEREIIASPSEIPPPGWGPTWVFLVDVAAPEEALRATRRALLAALDAAPPDASFGLVAFSDRVGLYDVSGDAPCVRNVAISERTGRACVALEDAVPLARLLAPVSDPSRRRVLVAAIEALRAPSTTGAASVAAAAAAARSAASPPPREHRGASETVEGAATLGGEAAVVDRTRERDERAPGGGLLATAAAAATASLARAAAAAAGGTNLGTSAADPATAADDDAAPSARGRRAFGPALEACVAWLEDLPQGGPFPRRVSCYLSGVPDRGVGALDDARFVAAKFAADSPDPAAAAKAADELSAPATAFYARLGDAAFAAKIVVDVFALGFRAAYMDLASVAPVADRSGGAAFYYRDDAAMLLPPGTVPTRPDDGDARGSAAVRSHHLDDFLSDSLLARDARVRVAASVEEATDCSLRARCSAEFRARRIPHGAGLVADDAFEGLHRAARVAREDCFAFDLEHRSGAGFGDRGDCPPTIQLAFEYVSLEKMFDPPGEEDEEGTEGPETATEPGTLRRDRDRDRPPQGPSRWLVRRIRRVCTRQARVASSPRDLYASADAEALFAALWRKIAVAADEVGLAEARALLSDWLVILVARFNHETGSARFDPACDAVVDGGFGGFDALADATRLVHAALVGDAFAIRSRWGPDERVARRLETARLSDARLAAFAYPRLVAFADADADADAVEDAAKGVVAGRVVRASRAAAQMSGGAAFVADAHSRVAVYYAPAPPGSRRAGAPFPPAPGSAVDAHWRSRAGEEARRGASSAAAPRVEMCRGGWDDARAFDDALVEERDVEEVPGGGGFRGFLASVEAQARQFMREA